MTPVTSVGIVGGLGPESTVDYYRRILEAWAREDPSTAPSIVIDSLDVQRALRLVDTDRAALVEYLLASLRRLAGAWRRNPTSIAAAQYAGHLGVPAIFPRWCLRELNELRGDRGAQLLLQRQGEHGQEALRGAVLNVARAVQPGGHRGDIDDAAAVSLDHPRQHRAG